MLVLVVLSVRGGLSRREGMGPSERGAKFMVNKANVVGLAGSLGGWLTSAIAPSFLLDRSLFWDNPPNQNKNIQKNSDLTDRFILLNFC